MKNGVYIIAEAGVNHNGSLPTALKLIDEAVLSGVDAIKFQTFKAKNLVNKSAKKAAYQEANTSGDQSQYEMLKKLELTEDDFATLKSYCEQKQIEFLSTPFDEDSLELLMAMGMKKIKIASGEITNIPLLRKIASYNVPIIMSTGMCKMSDIALALEELESLGQKDISVLHCNTEYPTPYEDVNLNAMQTIKNTFNVCVGYSDHTKGIEVPIAAVALGAMIIEKHFTLDKNMDGPDHKASLEPHELKQMVNSIRHVSQCLGDSVKRLSPSESKNVSVARKSVVAKRKIEAGEVLTEENLATKRPGTGLSPILWDVILGTKAIKDFEEDEMITL